MATTVSSLRSERINLRSSERQVYLLKQAASSTDMSMSEFILSSAIKEAERVLAERRWFVVSDQQFEDFMEALEEPVDINALRALYAEPSPFGQNFDLE